MLCLSIDIDWAHDAVIADTLELIETYRAKATWFATHATPQLDVIRSAGCHELGIHPNFNPLFEREPVSARDVVLRVVELVPDSVSVRSHSLVRSSRLSNIFTSLGQTHESNYLLPPYVALDLEPWRDWSGLTQVPIRWEDDVRLIDQTFGEPRRHLGRIRPLVVDFHPIHIFLNTVTISDYEAARSDAQFPSELLKRRRPAGSGGSRDRLIDLLTAAREEAVAQCRIRDFVAVREGF